MDSVTQIVLGAAVGEAVLGTKEGRKGALWGAILGIAPDADMLLTPFLDGVNQLATHRAATHSLLLTLVAAPLIGYGLKKLYPDGKARFTDWTRMALLALVTHIGVDLCTVYGTRAMWPINNTPYSFDNIFIIDPFYTIPLTLGLLIALVVKKKSRLRFAANMTGILLSSAYLTWSATAKLNAQGSFRQGLASSGRQIEKVMTAPTALNTFLWTGMGLHQDSISVGLYSVLDTRTPAKYTTFPRNTNLLQGHMEDRAIKRLMWFSKGWYGVEEDSLGLLYTDYRFGRTDSWLSDTGTPVFQFRLLKDAEGKYHTFENELPDMGNIRETLEAIYERAKGR